MQQFHEEEIMIDIPNATIIFPKGFDSQIARVYIHKYIYIYVYIYPFD